MEYIKWISVGMAPMLLLGMYRFCDKQMVISNQVHLINTFRHDIYKAQRSADQYVASIEKYCELKAIDDSWFYSLNSQQRAQMYRLRNHLGLDDIPDVNMATDIVRQVSEEMLEIMSGQLEELEDALGEMDLQKMRELQGLMSEKNFFKTQMEQIKSDIILSASHELQARGGVLYQIFSGFFKFLMTIITNIAVPMAAKLLHNMIL